MKKALFIHLPVISHINGGFTIANHLKSCGYEVYYLVTSDLAPYIKALGFIPYVNSANPFMENRRQSWQKRNRYKTPYFCTLLNSICKNEFTLRKSILEKVIDRISPNIIFDDTSNGADFVLCYNYLKERNIRFLAG